MPRMRRLSMRRRTEFSVRGAVMYPSVLRMAIVVVLSFAGLTFAAPTVGIAAQSPDEQKATDPPPAPSSQPASRSPTTQGIPQVGYINELIRRGWAQNRLSPSPVAPDFEWC